MTVLFFFFSPIRKEPVTDMLFDSFYSYVDFIYSASE
jgi:hypothetical protein